jgi:LAGLIDADG endonuclease
VANLWPVQYAGSLPSRVDLPSYISGYVDGEGCFTVSIAPRPTLRVGWEVRPSLSVSQNGDRNQVLLLIQRYFGCGTLRPDRSDLTVKWEVRNLSLLVSRVIPHFEAYPLLSGKQHDVELFTAVCRRMVRSEHLGAVGLAAIVRLVGEMNPSGVRRYSLTTILTSLAEMKA